jgi:hypothetical protein
MIGTTSIEVDIRPSILIGIFSQLYFPVFHFFFLSFFLSFRTFEIVLAGVKMCLWVNKHILNVPKDFNGSV